MLFSSTIFSSDSTMHLNAHAKPAIFLAGYTKPYSLMAIDMAKLAEPAILGSSQAIFSGTIWHPMSYPALTSKALLSLPS